MNKVYVAGVIFLFIGLLWMFSPHVIHETIEEEIDEGHDSSHFDNIIYGGIGTLTGLALVSLGNRKKETGKPDMPVYLVYVVAILSVSAGVIHGTLVPSHFEEWYGYGLFFVVAAIVQITYGIILLRNGKASRIYFVLGIVGNLAIIGLWIITRTYGIPFFGPEAGKVESIGAVDIFSKVIEGWLVLGLAMLARK